MADKSIDNRSFGPYVLLKRLGTGGMAEVWLAMRQGPLGTRKPVAVKCILPSYNGHEDYVRLFYREAALSLMMQHPNVMSVWDCGVIDGRHTMVMEYLQGVTLQALMERLAANNERLPLEVAVWIGIQILEGLGYVHSLKDWTGQPMGIVHRDVTPHNIFICFDGQCKIFDFGVARTAESEDRVQHGMMVGKCAYMSPEQCKGGHVDSRSDTFAMAAVIYEMATGKAVFARDNDIKTINAVTKEPITLPEKVVNRFPDDLSRIIMRGLQRVPDFRYKRAEDFASDLRGFMRKSAFMQNSEMLVSLMRQYYGTVMDELDQFFNDAIPEVDKAHPPLGMTSLLRQSDTNIGMEPVKGEAQIAFSKLSQIQAGEDPADIAARMRQMLLNR